ncbi:MAG: hypothetical protein K8R54_01390 [Bacteroidales bacterium]|nr:hypothetical protein [Bacteroidales bacterium]
MEIQTLKYKFIEEIIKINNPDILLSLNNFLDKLKNKKNSKSAWMQFAGIWDNEEADEISEIIKDCEKVDIKEW